MDLLLQTWGALFYLCNKIFFAWSEKVLVSNDIHKNRILKMIAWSCYLIGLPAWLIILVGEDNWITASIELGGVPAILLGLYNTYYSKDNDMSNAVSNSHDALINKLVLWITYAAIVFGVGYSVMVHGGITSLAQIFEFGIVIGYLLGCFLLAKNNINGWLFFILMNVSTALLMLIQDKPILMTQQLVSLTIVIYGYVMARKNVSV